MMQERITKHFLARVVGFIVVPFIFYLFFFWIHFAILTHSGTGDAFMSPAFQETLIGNELLMNSHGVFRFDGLAGLALIPLQRSVTLTQSPSSMWTQRTCCIRILSATPVITPIRELAVKVNKLRVTLMRMRTTTG